MSDRSQKRDGRLEALLGQFARQDPGLQLVFLESWAALQDKAGALLLAWTEVVAGSGPATPELMERMFAAEAASSSRASVRLAALRALAGLVAARLKAKKEDPPPAAGGGPVGAGGAPGAGVGAAPEGGARGALGGVARPAGPYDFGATG